MTIEIAKSSNVKLSPELIESEPMERVTCISA